MLCTYIHTLATKHPSSTYRLSNFFESRWKEWVNEMTWNVSQHTFGLHLLLKVRQHEKVQKWGEEHNRPALTLNEDISIMVITMSPKFHDLAQKYITSMKKDWKNIW